jgi:hypothetical protein
MVKKEVTEEGEVSLIPEKIYQRNWRGVSYF